MLVRFRQDVIGLRPGVVVIHAGTNDLARMLGPGTRGTFADNIMSMTELARANGIRVVLASILPVCDCFTEQSALRSPIRLGDFNEWLQEYASSSGAVYLDYFSALSEGRSFKRELTADGLVPNAAGYAVMAPLAEAAIAKALEEPVVRRSAVRGPQQRKTIMMRLTATMFALVVAAATAVSPRPGAWRWCVEHGRRRCAADRMGARPIRGSRRTPRRRGCSSCGSGSSTRARPR